MSKVQGRNNQPLSVTYTKDGIVKVIPITEVVKLFDPKDPDSLDKKYRETSLFSLLIKVSPRELMEEKIEGVPLRVKKKLFSPGFAKSGGKNMVMPMNVKKHLELVVRPKASRHFLF